MADATLASDIILIVDRITTKHILTIVLSPNTRIQIQNVISRKPKNISFGRNSEIIFILKLHK
jgi:hypothetical protein